MDTCASTNNHLHRDNIWNNNNDNNHHHYHYHHQPGRSIIAKNKEDTVISSSPTIVQKESTEGGAVAGGPNAGVASVPSGSLNTPSSPNAQVNHQVVGGVNQLLIQQAVAAAGATAGAATEPTAAELAELVLAEQNLFETLRNPLGQNGAGGPISASTVLAMAVAATASEPSSSLSGNAGHLPTVSTQLAAGLDGPGGCGGPSGASGSSGAATTAHAPLSSSGTIKQAGSQQSPRKTNSSGAASGECFCYGKLTPLILPRNH